MKSVLCYGDSLTWGYNPKDASRHPPNARWPGLLESELEGRARVIEEALNGRTVATDEPSRPNRNGLAMLPPLLEAHAPLDIVIIMLGSNDCAPAYGLTPGKIAMDCASLIRVTRSSLAAPGGGAPEILLIAPPPFGLLDPLSALFYAGGEATSQGLAEAYATIAQSFGCMFLDAAQVTHASALDGVHLDPPEQRKLALAVKNIVQPLL
jgi:lysophospholipase L1-like esterase